MEQTPPTYFKLEVRQPYAGESLDEWAAWLINEWTDFASMFVQVVAAFGETSDSTGLSKVRTWGGLNACRTLANPVKRAASRVRDGGISQATLPGGLNESLQGFLEDSGFVTAKLYAGLRGVFWGDSKTMAEASSDYLYEEVLRLSFL